MNVKALPLAAAILSASLFSASAIAAPLVCKAGEKPVTVKSLGSAKKGVVEVTYIVNETKAERSIQYMLTQIKAKKLAAGVVFCIDEADL